MKLYKSIARVFLLLLIVLLGLTVVAPEWLELKDMIISDYQKPHNPYPIEAPSHFVDETKDYLVNLAKFIHQRIIGQAPSYSGWFSNITNGLWSMFATIKAVIFIIFTFFLFLSMNDGFKIIYKPETKYSKGFLYFTTLIISFGSILFIWPYLGAIILIIAKLFIKFGMFFN